MSSTSPVFIQEYPPERSKIFERDFSNQIERRIKVLTEGKDDTADPCTPVEFNLPDGTNVCGMYFSGGRVIYYSSMEDMLRGGVRPFEKIKVLTKDGKPLKMEPFHQAEAIWDSELVVYKRKNILGEWETRFVGHGGMMERVNPEEPCSVVEHNYRRSRHAFNVGFVPTEIGFREVWTDAGPIHGNKPPLDGRWISTDEDQLHAHGYGSRLIRDKDDLPWRDKEGHMWITYEQVTDEKIFLGGKRLPFGTKIFARRMNEDLTMASGQPVLLSSYTPWSNEEKPFKASFRKDPQGEPAGFLVEGPNPILLNIGEKEYWVIFFSAGDFVAEYGNFMMFREKEEGPIGPYKHVVDQNGELIDLTASMVKDLDLTWAGRLNPFYDKQGKLWGVMHGIFKGEIPDAWNKCGWPRTQEEFICYARRVFLVPLVAGFEQNQPLVRVLEEKL